MHSIHEMKFRRRFSINPYKTLRMKLGEMSCSNFIPQVWSARLQENLKKALVFGSLCNRNWEGDIAQFGDTVHINTINDITVKPNKNGYRLGNIAIQVGYGIVELAAFAHNQSTAIFIFITETKIIKIERCLYGIIHSADGRC